MKCVSLWQPWASLLVAGEKFCETRTWHLQHRGPLLIHASKRWDSNIAFAAAEPLFMRPALKRCGFTLTADAKAAWGLPLGCIVGCVEVVGSIPTSECRLAISRGVSIQTGTHDGKPWRALNFDMKEQAMGDFSRGRFAWFCQNAVRFDQPIPYRGAMGLFDVPDSIVADAMKAGAA